MTKISVKPQNGLSETIKQMKYLELVSKNNAAFLSFVNKTFKTPCLSCIPGKVYSYIKNNFTYKDDAPFDEIIRAPHVLLTEKIGDCDDFAVFTKTVLDIIGGFDSYYMLLGAEQNKFTHVVVWCNRKGVHDPVLIDGANDLFNVLPSKYKFYKIV
ncbi:MAG: transglutaminase domain-containing protein [Sphingobacteriaceae bacterium]|nr:transglutaminase domain-containing protein [Sphingobacteriaceae bacterium]